MQVQGKKPYNEINITPLVDLTFVLLIFFILLTTAAVQGIKVDLPSASASQSLNEPKSRVIAVADDGTVSIDAVPVSMAELESELRTSIGSDPETAVILRRRPGGAVRPDHAGAGPVLQGGRGQPGHGLHPSAGRGLKAMTYAFMADEPPPPRRRSRISWPVRIVVGVLAVIVAVTFLRPSTVSERQREDKTVRVVLPPPGLRPRRPRSSRRRSRPSPSPRRSSSPVDTTPPPQDAPGPAHRRRQRPDRARRRRPILRSDGGRWVGQPYRRPTGRGRRRLRGLRQRRGHALACARRFQADRELRRAAIRPVFRWRWTLAGRIFLGAVLDRGCAPRPASAPDPAGASSARGGRRQRACRL